MAIAAVDFETFYSDEVSIIPLGVHHYLRHPECDIYMVSIATDTGIRYVGHPKDFDWTSISGPEWSWLSHNAQFDLPVFARLQELAVGNTLNVTELEAWHDTADLAAYLSVPRSLKEASKHLLGIEVNKDTRDKMKGKRWESMPEEFRREVEAYALADAENCLNLWLKHGHLWPEHEREISAMTRDMALKGVPIDVEALDRDIVKLETDLWELGQSVPWKDEPHNDPRKAKKGECKPILSLVAMREECVKQGLTPPSSFAQNDAEAERFFEEHAETYPWIKAVGIYRKSAKHLSTLKTMRSRVREDGWMGYGLKYGGAHTMRDSGDAGLNMQNLPKGEVCGVDIRAKIKAPEGYAFAIVDLSQIEPRCLHWLADDTKTLDYIRSIPDLYEAQARAWGIWNGEGELKKVAPEVRHMMKQLALGLGYGMGAKRFAEAAGVPAGEALRLTNLYRNKNPYVTQLWKRLENPMWAAARHSEEKNYIVNLPSGRELRYRNVKVVNEKLTAEIPRGRSFMRLGFWGGVLTENCLSGDTEVLTPRGWVKIIDVSTDDTVFDGVDFVSHSGLKFSGVQKVVEFNGVVATPDHPLLTNLGWKTVIELAQADRILVQDGHEAQLQESLKLVEWTFAGHSIAGDERKEPAVGSGLRLRLDQHQAGQGVDPEGRSPLLREELSVVVPESLGTAHDPRDGKAPSVRGLEVYGAKVHDQIASGLEKLWGPGDSGSGNVVGILPGVLGGHGHYVLSGTGVGPQGQRRELLQGELQVGLPVGQYAEQTHGLEESSQGAAGEFPGIGGGERDQKDGSLLPVEEGRALGSNLGHGSERQEPVYDLLNCGPRHRFVVRGGPGLPAMVAHNCVQATARDVFMHQCVQIENAGIPVLMRIHDEAVCLVREDEAKDRLEQIVSLMSTAPDWAEGLPLSAEGSISKVYKKG